MPNDLNVFQSDFGSLPDDEPDDTMEEEEDPEDLRIALTQAMSTILHDLNDQHNNNQNHQEGKTMQTPKRIFLVCRSKVCNEAKVSHVRCTLSVPEDNSAMCNIADTLNLRRFCTMYTASILTNGSNKPNWKVSPDKPSERTLKEREKKAEREFIENNPEFLEITTE